MWVQSVKELRQMTRKLEAGTSEIQTELVLKITWFMSKCMQPKRGLV